MKKLLASVMTVALIASALPALAAPAVGEAAPDFTATDINGKTVKLSDLKGKNVVLEWTNSECPYVVKHYSSGNMQKVQKEAVGQGVEWISINSSAPGRQGNVTPEQEKEILAKNEAAPSTVILDSDGAIGKAYDAKTTPHMFVIDKEGKLAYAGAIDDNPSPKPEDAATAKNYVLAALSDLEAGKPVETPTSQPYGCAVKYGE
jgi:peroxiredoxin